MTGGSKEPRDLRNEGTAGHLLRLLVTSKRAWAAVVVIAIVAGHVPTIAKVPVAIILAATAMVPLIGSLQVRPGSPSEQQEPVDPARGVRFEGFKGEQGPNRTKWRQVRCVLEGSELRIASFWYRGKPEVVSIQAARIASITTSGPRDLNLKPGRMRIIDLEIENSSPLRLAIDCSIEEGVRAALQAHA